MKSERLYEILEGINEDYINESEEYTKKRTLKSIFKTNKLALVAAVLALLLCGTAAAAGIMWLVPKIQEEENGFSVIYDGGYFELSDETFKTIVDTWGVTGESGEYRLLVIDSFKEWQNFFDIPIAVGEYINYDEEDKKLPEYENGVVVMRKGGLAAAVMMKEVNGEFTPYSMICDIPIALRYYDETELTHISKDSWSGNLFVQVALCKEAAKELKTTCYNYNVSNFELLEEFTTPSGIPCIITKSYVDNMGTSGGYSIAISLHYGYDSAIYSVGDSILVLDGVEPTERVDKMIAGLKDFANRVQIQYPAE